MNGTENIRPSKIEDTPRLCASRTLDAGPKKDERLPERVDKREVISLGAG